MRRGRPWRPIWLATLLLGAERLAAPVVPGEYELGFRARADRRRSVDVILQQDHPPLKMIGRYHSFELTPSWEGFTAEITASEPGQKARLQLSLASDMRDPGLVPEGAR